jgi:hypothetical protein
MHLWHQRLAGEKRDDSKAIRKILLVISKALPMEKRRSHP